MSDTPSFADRLLQPVPADPRAPGLTLRPDTGGALKGRLRQTRIKIKHLRFG